ncbi:MAG TPA: hypothetical protein VMJ32_14850 [Pirellulales bacterium]|nr:hypothetical protein [Pirellulales bacterium]
MNAIAGGVAGDVEFAGVDSDVDVAGQQCAGFELLEDETPFFSDRARVKKSSHVALP